MTQDEEHLRLLSIFHYVVGGLMALFACFPIIHFIAGTVFIIRSYGPNPSNDIPLSLAWQIAIIAGVIIITGWSIAACVIATGNFLANRKNYMFCLVMAGIESIFFPFGTVLGVFTIVVLVKESLGKPSMQTFLDSIPFGQRQNTGPDLSGSGESWVIYGRLRSGWHTFFR